MSCYFVGYVERSRGFKFYNPTTRSFEMENARFPEDVEFRGEENKVRNIVFEEEFISLLTNVIDND